MIDTVNLAFLLIVLIVSISAGGLCLLACIIAALGELLS